MWLASVSRWCARPGAAALSSAGVKGAFPKADMNPCQSSGEPRGVLTCFLRPADGLPILPIATLNFHVLVILAAQSRRETLR